MRTSFAPTAYGLTALLLMSVLAGLAMQAPLHHQTLDDDSTVSTAMARSTSAEILLASGGSTTHDEFSGAIAAADNGYMVAGDVNSSAAALTFGTQTYVPTSPYSNGNDVFLASLGNDGTWNFVVGPDHSQGGFSLMSDVASHTGNGIVAGQMYGPVSFGSTTLSSAVQFDI